MSILGSTREFRGLFDSILYIEQPLLRSRSIAPEVEPGVQRLGRLKPLIIDQADETTDSFKQAMSLGYAGVLHKNCKGIYKSLLNFARAETAKRSGRHGAVFLSAENLPTFRSFRFML